MAVSHFGGRKIFNHMSQKGFVNIVLIFVVIAIVAIGGYFIFSKKSVAPTEIQTQQPAPVSNEVKTPTSTQTATQPSNKTTSSSPSTDDWKVYRSEKYGLEFQYPAYWKVDEDTHFPFVQLQEIKNGEVIAIVGGITIIKKPISSSIDSSYEKMFASNSQCPVAAGSRNLSSESQYEEYVYCLTGKEIQMNTGTWKGAVECSASQWYGMKVDPNTCPHQFWIDTKDFFYVVHFNFFEPIKDNSEESIFFDKFLKGFSFF